jgi:hypothetical protein
VTDFPCRPSDQDRFFTVWVDARAEQWSEFEPLDLSRLSYDDAVEQAELHAQRLSAHWGHVRYRRWGRYSWRVWEPGEGGVDGWVRIRADEEVGL